VHHVESDDQAVGCRLGEGVRRATVTGADVNDDLTSMFQSDVELVARQADDPFSVHDAYALGP
jgi:hypothetical protein